MSSGILQGAHDFVLNNPHLEDNSSHVTAHQMNITTINATLTAEKRPGIARLLKASMPDAFHDSSARSPPPRCHPRTRQSYVAQLTEWGSSSDPTHVLWMWGPAGAGKSAVAQTVAERLAEQGRLGGSVFFSRPNKRNNPNALFTSIAYQLTTKLDAYADVLDHRIERDPTLVDKSIREQFQELLLKPLQKLDGDGVDVGEVALIVDGLDECEGQEAQCEIVETVAMSVRSGSTRFRWIFVSRPETHLIAAFNAGDVAGLSLHVELPVSREVDHDVLCFLADELMKIGRKNGLPSTWPSEDDLQKLLDLCAGLFIYAATTIRFVGEPNSLGPADQLRSVLELSKKAGGVDDLDHPLAELDLFYTLIMQRIPSKILPVIQKILLLQSLSISHPNGPRDPVYFANILRLSESQFRTACGALRSVLELELPTHSRFPRMKFYHASFMDFVQDPKRSGVFSVYSGCPDTLCSELLERLKNANLSRIEVKSLFDLSWPSDGDTFPENHYVYGYMIWVILCLASYHTRPFNSSMAAALLGLQFQRAAILCSDWRFSLSPEKLKQQLPLGLRNKIIRRSHNPLLRLRKPGYATSGIPYILGYGKNKVVCWECDTRGWGTEEEWGLQLYPTLSQTISVLLSSIRTAIF